MAQYTSSKELVVAICRTLLERGYLKATEGNVSVRVPGRALFAVTPSNYDYAKMEPDDICVLDYDLHRVSGTMKASIEAGLHAAVYQERPDVNVIIHTHQPYASALALIRQAHPGALRRAGACSSGAASQIVPYAPSGTSFLKRRVKAKVSKRRQRLHPRQPRRARAGRRRRARRPQHGPAREGGARLPAHAAGRREGGHHPGADPRDRLRQAARRPEEAGRTGGRGGARGRGRRDAARRRDAAPTGDAAAAARRSDRSGGAGPTPAARRRGGQPAPARRLRRPTSSATPSAATPTSRPCTPASSGS